MKKLTAIILASSLSTTALASPTIAVVDVFCPSTTIIGIHRLSNFGSFIAGYGTMNIDSNPANNPYFRYQIPAGANIPHSLTSYFNNGIDYDDTTGTLTCHYKSTGTFAPFSTVYTMTNATYGQIVTQTANSIRINLLIG